MQSNQFFDTAVSKTKSAFVPILLLAGIVGTAFVFAIWFGVADVYLNWLVGTFVFVVAAATCTYIWFVFRDPNRLQSEEYQIQRATLDVVAGRGQDAQLVQGEIIENPNVIRNSAAPNQESLGATP